MEAGGGPRVAPVKILGVSMVRDVVDPRFPLAARAARRSY